MYPGCRSKSSWICLLLASDGIPRLPQLLPALGQLKWLPTARSQAFEEFATKEAAMLELHGGGFQMTAQQPALLPPRHPIAVALNHVACILSLLLYAAFTFCWALLRAFTTSFGSSKSGAGESRSLADSEQCSRKEQTQTHFTSKHLLKFFLLEG